MGFSTNDWSILKDIKIYIYASLLRKIEIQHCLIKIIHYGYFIIFIKYFCWEESP